MRRVKMLFLIPHPYKSTLGPDAILAVRPGP